MAFWEYQPRTQYNRQRRRAFEQYARSKAYSEVIAPRLAQRTNLPPQMFQRSPYSKPQPTPISDDDIDAVQAKPTEADINKAPEWAREELRRKVGLKPAEKPRGILGLAGDVTKAVGLNDLEEPWDYLRPVKRLMDLEQKHIAKPITEEIYSGGVVTKALGLDYDFNEDVPGFVKWGTEMAVSPSTWLGPGTAIALVKGGSKLAWNAPAIAGMAASPGSRRAFQEVFGQVIKEGGRGRLPPIGGGGGVDEVTKFLDKLKNAGDDTLRARNLDELVADAQSRKSLTRVVRGKLDQLLTPQQHNSILDTIRRTTRSGIEDVAGIRLFDGPVGPVIGEYQRIHNIGNNAANLQIDGGLRIAARRSAIAMDSTGSRITDPDLITQAAKIIPDYQTGDPLFVSDFVAYASKFNLNKAQQAFIDAYDQTHDLYRGVEKAAKVDISERKLEEGIRYVHSERVRQPVEIGQYDELGNRIGSTKNTRTLGQVVNARMGGRQTASYAREFDTELAGWKSGIEYLPFFEGQRARMQQSFKLIADKYLDNALNKFGRTPTQLLDPALTDRAVELAKRRSQGMNLARRLEEAIRHSNARTGSWRPLNDKFYSELPAEMKSIVDRAIHVSQNVTKANLRKSDFNALRDELGEVMKPIIANRKKVAGELKEAKSLIGRQGAGEFTERVAGRFYDPKLGGVLKRELVPTPATGIEKGMQKLNDLARPLMATLDASFLGIQGLVAFAHNPEAWTVAMKNSMFGGYDAYIETALRSGLADDFIRHKGFFAAKNDFGDFITPPLISKIPVVGQAANISGTWWTQFGNILRLEMYKNATGNGLKTLSRADREGLAKLINNATGYSDSPLTRMERIGEFAPRFFRSQFGLLADAVTKWDMPGWKAKQMVAQLFGEGIMLTAIVNELSEEAGLGGADLDWMNPESPNFMKMRIAGHDVSVFGTWDTLARMVIRGIPYDLEEGEFDIKRPFEGAMYSARVKASPVMGRIYDLIDGETFTGDQVRDFSSPTAIAESLANLGRQSLLPISVQNLLTEGDPTDWRSYAVGGVEMAGVKTAPLSDYEAQEQNRNRVAQETYGRDWSELERWERYELINKDPNLEYKDNEDQARATRDALGDRFKARQQRIDDRFEGKEWIDAYQRNMAERAGAYDQWAAEHPDAAAALKSRKPRNANEQAEKEYYDFFDRAKEQALLPEEIAEGLEEIEANWTDEQKSWMERNIGLNNTDKVKQYRKVQKVLKPYWRVEEAIWQRLKQEGKVDEESFSDYVDATTQRLLERGVSPELIARRLNNIPMIRRMTQAVSAARERMRLRNREIDQLLVEWYDYTPVRIARAQQSR